MGASWFCRRLHLIIWLVKCLPVGNTSTYISNIPKICRLKAQPIEGRCQPRTWLGGHVWTLWGCRYTGRRLGWRSRESIKRADRWHSLEGIKRVDRGFMFLSGRCRSWGVVIPNNYIYIKNRRTFLESRRLTRTCSMGCICLNFHSSLDVGFWKEWINIVGILTIPDCRLDWGHMASVVRRFMN